MMTQRQVSTLILSGKKVYRIGAEVLVARFYQVAECGVVSMSWHHAIRKLLANGILLRIGNGPRIRSIRRQRRKFGGSVGGAGMSGMLLLRDGRSMERVARSAERPECMIHEITPVLA